MIVFLVIISVMGCTKNPEKKQLPLWNSTQYFEQEIIKLNQKNIGLQKQLSFNNNKNEITSTNVNWEKELSVFTLIDLSNLKNSGSYNLDSLITIDTLITFEYKAIEAKNKLQLCTISLNPKDQKIICVYAKYKEITNLYQVEKNIIYNASQGFKILGSQQVKFGKSSTYSITGTFINP